MLRISYLKPRIENASDKQACPPALAIKKCFQGRGTLPISRTVPVTVSPRVCSITPALWFVVTLCFPPHMSLHS